jgi:hypothetical protein
LPSMVTRPRLRAPRNHSAPSGPLRPASFKGLREEG